MINKGQKIFIKLKNELHVTDGFIEERERTIRCNKVTVDKNNIASVEYA